MHLRRLGHLAAALIAAAVLTACSIDNTVEADAKAPASTSTASPGRSGSPGGSADNAGLSLADAIATLPEAEEKRAGYKRTSFRHWIDEDGDGCTTRQEVLLAEAVTPPEQGPRCALTGGEWLSYYDEVKVTDPRNLDIDHVVPLAEAWDSGAYDWTPERRQAYANDLGAERSLVAVTAAKNRAKGDKDPADWMPPAESATCTYLADWVGTKLRWGLSADSTELAALKKLSAGCKDTTVKYEKAA
ncbi:HNH endonuclease family protein [Streptomyces sp. NPDC088252]|uniref:HNH endonuclease family protein n=1 Tax=unclassified Streptomyces TaxID=2593676 RepID=UPI0037F8FD3C